MFTICIGRFDDIKARIQGKKHSKVEHLASIFNAVATFLGHIKMPMKIVNTGSKMSDLGCSIFLRF